VSKLGARPEKFAICRQDTNFGTPHRSNKAIGEGLFITEHTVEKHVKSIFGSLGLPPSPDDHRRVLAVVKFLDAQ
jgi:hypothetical protein